MAKIKVKSITKGTMATPLVVSTPEPVAVVPTVSPVPSEHDYPPVPQTPLKDLLCIIPPPPPPPPPPPCPCPIPPLPRPPLPPPPIPFIPKPCCPSTSQIVDNVTVRSLDETKIDVIEGSYQGMKSYGIDAKTFEGIGTTGVVPMPVSGDEGRVLTSDGKWTEIVIPEQQQSDWAQTDTRSPTYIKNKPDIDSMVLAATTEVIAGENTRVVHTEDPTDHHNVYTIHADGKPQVQADWNQTDEEAVDYIKNKPDLDADVTSSDGTNVQVNVTQSDGKITGVSIVTDNTVGRGDGTFTEGNIPEFDENGNIIDSGLRVESSIQGISDADGTAFDITDHIACVPTAVEGNVIDPETKETHCGNLGLVTIATIEL